MKNKIFAERLQETRQQLGLTQEELAERAGVSRELIPLCEGCLDDRGTILFLDSAMMIAKSLGVSLDWLCGMTDSQQNDDNDFRKLWDAIVSLCKLKHVKIGSNSSNLFWIEISDPILCEKLGLLKFYFSLFGNCIESDHDLEIMSYLASHCEIVDGEIRKREEYAQS